MNPRGFLGTFIFLANIISLPIAVLCSLMFSLIFEIGFLQALLELGIWVGLLSGLTSSFFIAFFLQTITITIPMKEQNQFIRNMNVSLSEIGYYPQSQISDLLIYKPSVQAGLLAGKISVQINKENAIIVGPSIYVRKINKKFM